MRDEKSQEAPLRPARHARLFSLFQQESPPDDDLRPAKEQTLTKEQAIGLQRRAIASLSRGTPLRQRIFRKSRSGWPAV